jgi:hypothetical protein
VVRINEQKGRHSAAFRPVPGVAKRMSRVGRLAERQEPGSNTLNVIFQWVRITYHLTILWETLIFQGVPQSSWLTAFRAVFDPDLEQGGNINVVVRSDSATGAGIRVLVHRWCHPGRAETTGSTAYGGAASGTG